MKTLMIYSDAIGHLVIETMALQCYCGVLSLFAAAVPLFSLFCHIYVQFLSFGIAWGLNLLINLFLPLMHVAGKGGCMGVVPRGDILIR